jgi:alcohol dehydrogenase
MLLGAHLAGSAIERSMLGAAHAAANPLTAHFGVTHGVAVGIMLPWVVRFNAATTPELYAELAVTFENAEDLASGLTSWLEVAGLPTSLREAKVDAAAMPELAKEAADQWTAAFNPRPVGVDDFECLYRSAY